RPRLPPGGGRVRAPHPRARLVGQLADEPDLVRVTLAVQVVAPHVGNGRARRIDSHPGHHEVAAEVAAIGGGNRAHGRCRSMSLRKPTKTHNADVATTATTSATPIHVTAATTNSQASVIPPPRAGPSRAGRAARPPRAASRRARSPPGGAPRGCLGGARAR